MNESLQLSSEIYVGRRTDKVLAAPIDVIDWSTALERIHDWGLRRASKYVCICNVHSVVTAFEDPEFLNVLNNADMTTPDGAPVAWMLRQLGHRDQQRISGPDLMWRYCERAARSGQRIFLLGSEPRTLGSLQDRLLAHFPGLQLAGSHSPPFRPLTAAEDTALVAMINSSGANVVFVSLGCPKQEVWMAAHRGQVSAVMIGVGAAFSFHAGVMRRAPPWMQRLGLEWLHRLLSEPHRLWRRYLRTNSQFLWLGGRQLLRRARD